MAVELGIRFCPKPELVAQVKGYVGARVSQRAP